MTKNKTKFDEIYEQYLNTPVKNTDEFLITHKEHLNKFYELENEILKFGAKIGFELGREYERAKSQKLVEALTRIRYNNYRGINQSVEMQEIAGFALKAYEEDV